MPPEGLGLKGPSPTHEEIEMASFFFFKFQNRQKQSCPLYLVDVVCGKLCLCLQEQWAYAGCLLSLSLL